MTGQGQERYRDVVFEGRPRERRPYRKCSRRLAVSAHVKAVARRHGRDGRASTGETPVPHLDAFTGETPVPHLDAFAGETLVPHLDACTGETPVPHPDACTGETPVPHLDDGARFLRGVLERAGLEGRHYRPEPLARRLHACLRGLKVGSVAEAEALLAADPSRWSVVLNALLIGVTGFFRDAQVFDALRRQVLPGLLERRPGGIRVWSAACSDGSELYSIAMLLAELGALSGSTLVGSDCRPAAIEGARAGRYPREMLELVPDDLRGRYCRPEGAGMGLADELREAVEWRVADVLSEPPQGTWDLVSCRNLTIYLDPAPATKLWAGLEAVLRPGGVLMVGKAERPGGKLRRVSHCIYTAAGARAMEKMS